MTTRIRIAAVVLGGLILAAAVAWLSSDSRNSGSGAQPAARYSGAAPSESRTAPIPQRSARATRSLSEPALRAREVSSPAPPNSTPPGTVSAIENYLARTIYPPDSQPLDPTRHLDRIEWNTRRDHARQAPEDPELTILYTANAYTIFGDDAIHSRLRVQRGTELQQVEILQASATIEASDMENAPPPDAAVHIRE